VVEILDPNLDGHHTSLRHDRRRRHHGG